MQLPELDDYESNKTQLKLFLKCNWQLPTCIFLSIYLRFFFCIFFLLLFYFFLSYFLVPHPFRFIFLFFFSASRHSPEKNTRTLNTENSTPMLYPITNRLLPPRHSHHHSPAVAHTRPKHIMGVQNKKMEREAKQRKINRKTEYTNNDSNPRFCSGRSASYETRFYIVH